MVKPDEVTWELYKVVRTEVAPFIDKMSPQEYRNKVKTSKQFRDQLEAAGISVVGKAQYGY